MISALTLIQPQLRSLFLLIGAGTMALAGCSPNPLSVPPPGTETDLNGVWRVWTTEAGQVEVGPAALFLSVSESTISGADLLGTANGSTFQFAAAVKDGTTAVEGTLTTATTGAGTYTTTKTSGPTITGTFRIAKFSPTGFFSVNGSILGQTITHETNEAVGILKFLDPARTKLIETEVVTGSVGLNFELDFDPTNLEIGNLTAGMGDNDAGVAVEFSTGASSARAIAIGGTIIVTDYDASEFAATFTLNLDTGDSVTGVIDVHFDIEALHPFGLQSLFQ